MRRYANVTYTGPDWQGIVKGVVRGYLPKAGAKIMFTARRKIGTYQPGWAPLAPATLRKKRRSLAKMGKRAPWMRYTGGGADHPLLDKGKMANSISHYERGDSTHIVADFPMGQHEQDPEVGQFKIPALIPLPRRAVMWPSLEESMPALVSELEDEVARAL